MCSLLSMRLFTFILLLFTFACHTNQNEKIKPSTILVDTLVNVSDKKIVTDSFINGERIDGPANIRDTSNGKLLFIVNDNVIVTSTEAKDKWLQIGIFADLTQKQMDCLCLPKGSPIFSEGKKVGQAVENIQLRGAFKSNEGLQGELSGYTSVSNIKRNTIPENAFSDIINLSSKPLTITDFKKFISDFKFIESNNILTGFNCFQIDENWIDDPSPLLRLWLLFKDDNFYGVVHSRPLQLKDGKTIKVKRGFYLTTFNLDHNTTQKIISAFDSYIVQVD